MVRAVDWHELSRRAGPWFLVLALASWGLAAHRGMLRPQPDLYPFLKRAWPGAEYAPRPAAHLHERLSGAAQRSPENLVGTTFVGASSSTR